VAGTARRRRRKSPDEREEAVETNGARVDIGTSQQIDEKLETL